MKNKLEAQNTSPYSYIAQQFFVEHVLQVNTFCKQFEKVSVSTFPFICFCNFPRLFPIL